MISVVIPAYNSEKTLPYTLQALQKQTLPRELYEVIVIDDASTDGTASVAREFGVRYRRQTKEGPAAARNLGVRISRGDIVLFTDSDCIPKDDWIAKMVKPFEDPKVAGVMGRYLTRQREYAARFVQLEFEERFSIIKEHDSIDLVPSFAAAFRRSVFDEVGGFDAHYPLANNEDVELSYKIAARGYKMVFVNDAIVYHKHPLCWKKYFGVKYSRAFWRTLVYKKFPGKIFKDTYTPQSLKAQMLTAWFLVISTLGFIFNTTWGAATIGLAGALFLTSCVPFTKRTYKFDPALSMAAPLILFPKSIIFGFGVFLGFITGSERDTIFPVVLAVFDAVMSAAALTLGFIVRSKLFNAPVVFSKPVEYFYPLLAIFPLTVLFVFRQMGLYRVKTCLSKLSQLLLYFKAFAVVSLLVMAGMFLLKMSYSRVLLAVVFLTSLVLMGLSRLLLNSLHDKMMARGVNATRVLLVGCGETAQMLVEKTHNFPTLGYYVVGFIAEAGLGKRYLGKEILGSTQDILKIIEEYQVDEVIFARPNLSREKVLNLIVHLENADVSVKMISDLYDIVTSQTVIDGIADIPMIEIHKQRFRRLQDLVKVSMDYLLGTFFLVISLPFWVVIGSIICLESHGPIIIRSQRVGIKSKLFEIFKFRTLYRDVESEDQSPTESNDPRITKFGRFLRRTSLDEWPQLLNILLNQMSLVGPRPEIPKIVEKYKEWQRLRLEVKPGITGLWQIMGRRDLFLHQNLEYDFYYIKNRSLLLDLIILMRTIPSMIFGPSISNRGWLINADIERSDFGKLVEEPPKEEPYRHSARA
ncbi:MAG: exopolysaccharide biosynthesis polyprenyl glycosylphosphotransferase [bacterium]|nr:exopolysaccharide biosynthesis polyprenyl glycosylphosphotransferase [bacterium]